MEREKWGSRTAFILAAVGSAVGLGNAWRFPGLAYKYGGGTFLLVYIIAMIFLGFPLLLMEITIGRKIKQGAPGSMRGINKNCEWIGWSAVSNAFVISAYYSVVLGWVLFMIVKSFSFASIGVGNAAADSAKNMFYTKVIQISDSLTSPDAYTIPVGMIIAVIVGWLLIYLSIRKGTTSVGKVVPVTVFLPVVFLIIMAIKGFTLDGAMEGMAKYLTPNLGQLKNPLLWNAAIGQVFYSLSIMMAIMFAYGSFLPSDGDVVKDAMIIAFSDLFISFLSGIVLFTTIYGTGMEKSFTESGIGTAFIVYPQALVYMTKSATVNAIFALVFYLCLFTLAIDSAFSIVEGVSTAISDKFHLKKYKTTLILCIVTGIISLIFATRSGLYWLDIVDNWANSVNLLFVGILECIAVGWFFKTDKLRMEFNATTTLKLGKWYNYLIKFFCPIALLFLFVWGLYGYFTTIDPKTGIMGYGGYPMWAQFAGGWIVSILVFASGFIIKFFERNDEKKLSWDDFE